MVDNKNKEDHTGGLKGTNLLNDLPELTVNDPVSSYQNPTGNDFGEGVQVAGIKSDLAKGALKWISGKFKTKPKHQLPKGTGAKPHTVVNALKNFKGRNYQFGSHTFKLDKKGFKHILERHHPSFWNGSKKAKQTFFDKSMKVDDVQDAIGSVLKQNRELLAKKGTQRMYQMEGVYKGKVYKLGVNKGRIGQFYPK